MLSSGTERMKNKSLSDELKFTVATILATNNVSKISKKYIKSIQVNDLNGNIRNFKNYEGLKRYLRNMAQKLSNKASAADGEEYNSISSTIQLIMNYDVATMERDIKNEVVRIFGRHKLEGNLYDTNRPSNRNNSNNRGNSSSMPPQRKR